MRRAAVEHRGDDAERGQPGEKRPAIQLAALQALDGKLDTVLREGIHEQPPLLFSTLAGCKNRAS